MAGTINLSLTQQLDEFGQPLSGGQLYFIQAGTVSTPQNAYVDTALSIVQPNPITLDAAGRVPQFFLADGQIKVRLTDRYGVVKFTADNLLVIGPSTGGGGGGGGAVDPTTVMSTGDLKCRYDTAILPGWVRANGKTIGSAISGGTELADPTAQALFQFLWGVDTSLPVIPSRGVSAIADWTANRQITLPDWRGCVLAGRDGMGNIAATRLSAPYFTASDTLGSSGGSQVCVLDATQMPAHYHIVGIYDTGHTHGINDIHSLVSPGGTVTPLGAGAYAAFNPSAAFSIAAATTGIRVNSPNGLDTTYTAGGSAPHGIIQPTRVTTIYLKL